MAGENRSPKKKTAIFLLLFVVALNVVLIAIPWIISIREANFPVDTAVSISCPDVTTSIGEYGYGASDELAFVASVTNEGPFMWDEDYWQTTEYSMHYDGTLEITNTYSLSGERTTVCHVNETDFNTIMCLAQKVMDEKPYEDMDYSSYMDGFTWGFSIYDTNGAATYIYGGYTYGIDDLETIEGILSRYESLKDEF